MPRPWNHHLYIGEVWNNEELGFIEQRDQIVARIKLLPHYSDEDDGDGELWWIVDELADTKNEDEFDSVWDAFYDWADDNRVWVDRFLSDEEATAKHRKEIEARLQKSSQPT